MLVLHLLSLPFMFRKRNEPGVITRFAMFGAFLGVLQIVWAAWMVLGGFPGVVRSLHQATGFFIWVTTVAMAYHSRIVAGRSALTSSTSGAVVSPDVAAGMVR
jgi:heme A synthase